MAGPASATRPPWPAQVRRVVVKIGSRALVDASNRLDETQIGALVEQLAALQAGGREVILVSSGAIPAGMGVMGLAARPRHLRVQQAAAAIGQARLIGLYRERFAAHDLGVGQVLLTHGDLRARGRHLNARHTLGHLLELGMVPIVNENDTVAVDEIRFGDNDVLSALVAMLVRADALIMLSTVAGLMDRPPAEGGRLIEMVEAITPELRAMAGDSDSDVTRGGMRTKLEAADMVTRAGEYCVIADGRRANVLADLFAGAPLGTLFVPGGSRMAGRKRWIAFFDRPSGEIEVDAGAVRALREKGGSLLAIGVTAVRGDFDKGAPIRIVDAAGAEIARGLVNYSSGELLQIAGLRSEQIVHVLGGCDYERVVHRDNLVLR